MIKAQDYFQQNESKAGTCVQSLLVKARRVSTGDKIFVNMGLPVSTTAPEDGYLVSIGDKSRFMDFEEYSELKTELKEVDPVDYYGAKQDLPEDAKPKQVKKGQTIVVQPWSDTTLGVQADAEQDGWLVTLDGKRRFFSDLAFRSMFNTNAKPQNLDEVLLTNKEEGPEVRFIVLDEDVTFDFIEGECKVSAGYVLYENADDVDGYTVVPADDFEATYRVTADRVQPAVQEKRKPKGEVPNPFDKLGKNGPGK